MTRHGVKADNQQPVAELVFGGHIYASGGVDVNSVLAMDLAADTYTATYQGVKLVVKLLDTKAYPKREFGFTSELKSFTLARAAQDTALHRLAGLFELGPLQCLVFEPAKKALTSKQCKGKTIRWVTHWAFMRLTSGKKTLECIKEIHAHGYCPRCV